jgi:hypothetical protein
LIEDIQIFLDISFLFKKIHTVGGHIELEQELEMLAGD